MELRPYQHDLVNEAMTALGQDEAPCVVAPTGAGKTVILAEIVRQLLERGEEVLIGAHRLEIIKQITKSLHRHLGEVPQLITANTTTPLQRVTVAMIPTLTRRRRWIERMAGRAYLLDECFPAGTLVDGIPIERLAVGALVRCFDHATGTIVHRPVVRLFRNPAPPAMVHLRLSDGRELACTPGHPIWTPAGYTPAAELRPGCIVMLATTSQHGVPDPLRDLWRSGLHQPSQQVRIQEARLGLLQQSVLNGLSLVSVLDSHGRDKQEARLAANDRAQPDGATGDTGQGLYPPSGDAMETSSAGRQWQALASASAFAGVHAWVGGGSFRENRSQHNGWDAFPSLLQAGHRLPRTEDWRRNRRLQPHRAGEAGAGQEERCQTGFAWVDSVEVQQQGSAGQSPGMCSDGLVYNVEVAEHHNYFANDVLVHNCHHQPAPSYVRLREALNPSRFLGVTATPITPTGGGLGRHFDRLILGPEPRWLMDNGFLCDYRLYGAPAEIDTAGVSTRGGDYALDELEDRVQAIAGNVLRDWHRFNPKGLSTITVGLSVEHAHQLAELYRAAGITAVAVDGKTSPGDRERIFDAFRGGGVTVLCACAVVDEGLDVPEASCLQLLRPTKSIRLYRQLIGRVLRPADEKEHAIIIDHGGSWRDLPLPDERIPWSLEERVRTPRAENRNVSRDEEFIVTRRPPVAIEDHRPLVLINGRAEQAGRAEAAKRSLRKMLGLVRRGIVPANALYNQLHNARYFDDGELMALQLELNMPDNWAEHQGWLNAVS